ncbi:MAG: hypothetical protein HWE30_03480 [Methylocystaceae bacterium]|nr:hypothetical protein [Methylocystaceae bacterium]
MSEIKKTALELYNRHGLKQASFIAFHNMQMAADGRDADFWLHVVNHITLLDALGEETQSITQKNLL